MQLRPAPEHNDRKNKDIVFNSRYIDIDDYACPLNIGADGKLPEDTTLALQLDLDNYRRVKVSDPKIRSSIYRFVYSFNINSIDVGSGDFAKGLQNYVHSGWYDGPERILIDTRQHGFTEYSNQGNTYSVNQKTIDFNLKEFDEFIAERMEADPSWLITTVNALMHKQNIETLLNYDMIYSLPSPLEMEKQGIIERLDAHSYRVKTGDEANHKVEFDHGLYLDRPEEDMQGVGINLRSRTLVLRSVPVTDKNFVFTQKMNLVRHPARLMEFEKDSLLPPFRKKMDGVTCLVKKITARLFVKTPLSYEVFVVSDDYDGPFDEFEIECELLDCGVLVLHTVWELGGQAVPPGYTGLCEEFVKKLKFEGWKYQLYSKISFDSVDECLTTKEEFGDISVDLAEGVSANGVVAKVVETLDLDTRTMSEICEFCIEHYDIVPVSDDIPPGQIWECAVARSRTDLAISMFRYRYDKQAPNSFGRCRQLIENLLDPMGHHLTDYMSTAALHRYGISEKNLGSLATQN